MPSPSQISQPQAGSAVWGDSPPHCDFHPTPTHPQNFLKVSAKAICTFSGILTYPNTKSLCGCEKQTPHSRWKRGKKNKPKTYSVSLSTFSDITSTASYGHQVLQYSLLFSENKKLRVAHKKWMPWIFTLNDYKEKLEDMKWVCLKP